MRAVVPDELIEERRRLGLDRRDEVWDGVLHMIPPASSAHGRLEARLAAVFDPVARARGLWLVAEPGLFEPGTQGMASYRVPDLGLARPGDVSDRGIEGRAVLVVEVLSPGDESLQKLSFYRQVGVEELLYVEPTTRVFEARRPDGDGWRLVAWEDDGWTPLESLGLAVRTSGQRLWVRTDAGIEEV